MVIGNLASAALVLACAYGHPTNIGCDLMHHGHNIASSDHKIMGYAPSDDADLASTSATSYDANTTVTISFGSNFVSGLVHATAGTLNAPDFTATASSGCQGDNVIKYIKQSSGTPNNITWTPPSDVSALATVTLTVAGAKGKSTVFRKKVVLKNADASVTNRPAASGTVVSSKAALLALVFAWLGL
eukprot:TRINITY_DN5738_c1_g1_i1.p1 TRINITY_DN5738_c1_g1~~TRINITY_DN5738_c1_g1_i1.p1  ORF type:complete len:187 (+),score=23.06 TRINITY_DN5738_c1_g1_i1:80-640(+)